jgi:hypothetical protein
VEPAGGEGEASDQDEDEDDKPDLDHLDEEALVRKVCHV